jgi:hypothetical protein
MIIVLLKLDVLGNEENVKFMVQYHLEEEIDLEKLRMVVTGKSNELPKILAMNLLQNHEYPNKHEDLQAVLENNNESSALRYLAAINLARANIADAQDILINNITQIDDERVLYGIVKALGQLGDSRAISALLNIKNTKKGFVSSKANFAVALISYRFGLEGNELSIPTEEEYLKMSGDTQPIKISKASREEINKCVDFISDRQFGIQLAQEPVYEVITGRDTHMVLLNKQYTDLENAKQLLQRKSMLGIIAYKSEEDKSYSVRYLVLTSPATQSNGNIDVIITSPDGNIMFGGMLSIGDNNIKFSIRSTTQLGGFPLLIEGNLIDREFRLISAEFSTSGGISKQAPEDKNSIGAI